MIWVINNNYIIVKSESMKKDKSHLLTVDISFLYTREPATVLRIYSAILYVPVSVEGVLFN